MLTNKAFVMYYAKMCFYDVPNYYAYTNYKVHDSHQKQYLKSDAKHCCQSY